MFSFFFPDSSSPSSSLIFHPHALRVSITLLLCSLLFKPAMDTTKGKLPRGKEPAGPFKDEAKREYPSWVAPEIIKGIAMDNYLFKEYLDRIRKSRGNSEVDTKQIKKQKLSIEDMRRSKWNHPVLYDVLDDGSDRSDDSDSEKEPDLSKFFFVDEMQKVDSTKGKLPSGKKPRAI
ncbi:hypothetical protein QL285_042843 [Trifolium repens]|nr:hypothetical protein QL285_042843 [Trifolium repens]